MHRRRPAQLAALASVAVVAAQLGGLPASPSVAAGGHGAGHTVGKPAGHGSVQHTKHAKHAKHAKRAETRGDYDARQGATAAERTSLQAQAMVDSAKPAVQSFASSLGGQSVVDIDPLTGTPSQVSRLDGLLTGPSSASARSVALGFVRAHSDVFKLGDADVDGLRLTRDYVDVAGIHHLSFSQRVGGVTVFGNGLKANVTRTGRLINVQGAPVAGLAAQAPVGGGLTQEQAVAKARRDAGAASTTPTSLDSAHRVLFLTPSGLRRAYEVVTMSSTDPTLAVVDATSGWVLYRDHLADDFASSADSTSGQPAADPSGHQYALAYPNYPGAPQGGSQVRVDLTAPGWLPTGSTTLVGNNARTYTDVDDDNKQGSQERVKPLANGNFTYRLNPFLPTQFGCSKTVICDWQPNQPYSWQVNRKQTATNNFVLINQYHDYLEQPPIGFTEAAGNFQKVNSSGEGKGGDPVVDQPLDGADTDSGLPDPDHIDNANFATPPDGQAPTMQMYLFHQPGTTFEQDPFIPASGADEADIVLHEYTHGLSHRLVVDANNVPALDSQQGGSMGEAWSDYYALDYLRNKGLIADQPGVADVVEGAYVTKGAGIRSEATDCRVDSPASQCPGGAATGPGGYTYGDFGKVTSGPEVHADGEIWAQTLWQLRDTLGATVTDSVVTRGMELSPTFPSYLDMRNAIVLADQAVYGGAHVDQIWTVFAERGMGFFAGTVTGDDTAPVEDFSTPPPADAPTGTVTGTVRDSATDQGVGGVVVAFGGHDSGLPGASWATTTGADGSYTIRDVTAGTYPDVYAFGTGYDLAKQTVTVTAGTTTQDFSLVRDWAAASGGATIADTNGNEYAAYGCGAVADIDQSTSAGWVANVPTPPASKYLVVQLPQAVDLSTVGVNPAASCGVAGSASVADYTVETSQDGTTYQTASAGTFTVADRGHLVQLTLAPGSGDAVRYVRFTMLTNQVSQIGGSCPGPYDGCTYIASTELEAFGTPAG